MDSAEPLTQSGAWKNRLAALKEAPLVWVLLRDSAPAAVYGTIFLRVLGGLAPLGMLFAAKQIMDMITAAAKGTAVDASVLWMWVGIEFGLAGVSQVIGRGVDFLDSVIADRFSHSLGLKIMRHAASLDLIVSKTLPFTTCWKGPGRSRRTGLEC